MKKFIITMAIISILLLINVSVFAEPMNKDLHHKFDGEIGLETMGESLIISMKDAQNFFLRETFTKVKDNLDVLLMRIKEVVRFKIEINLDFTDSGKILPRLQRQDDEKKPIRYNFLDNIKIFKKDWDGKDRIISLDLDEDGNIDKFY